jgi:hypothetical protein
MHQSITPATRIVATRDQVSCDLEGEAAVLKLSTGMYYGLDRVGASIWQQIQKPLEVAAVRDALTREYDIDAATAEADLISFVEKLIEEGLVEVVADAHSAD